MNKIWEVIEKEAQRSSDADGHSYRGYRRGMSADEMHSYRKMSYKKDEVEDAYECGFEDGYSEAMRKIFHIIKDSDK